MSKSDEERGLLQQLRAQPADEATRMVYGDWLEQRGEHTKARYVRGEHLERAMPATDHAWRAITSREPVVNCVDDRCPKAWSSFVPVDQNERRCEPCGATIRYCPGWIEAHAAAERGETVVLDFRGRNPADFQLALLSRRRSK